MYIMDKVSSYTARSSITNYRRKEAETGLCEIKFWLDYVKSLKFP